MTDPKIDLDSMLTAKGRAKRDAELRHPMRAQLIEAPDMPDYEDLAELTLEELEALPARWHIPRFDDCGVPNLWYCVPCSHTEGVVVGWPCVTAQRHGKDVFER